jgi:tungstate transport system ATP-binding protein
LIELKDISKKYDDISVLEQVNWRFKSNAITVLIGLSGSGKTTLLRIMDLLEEPTSGQIVFDGVLVGTAESERLDLRRKMSLVSQRPVLFNDTVYQNVVYGLNVRGVSADLRKEKADWILDVVGLAGFENRKSDTLSGGEIQRVAIARSLITNPDVLFLDEPTTNLDVKSKATIEDLILRIPQEFKTSIIMATHDIRQCTRMADDIVSITDNHLIAVRYPQEIFGVTADSEDIMKQGSVTGLVTNNQDGLITIKVGKEFVYGISDIKTGEQVSILVSR